MPRHSRELRERNWTDLSEAFLDKTCSPTLLTARAAIFLPAWLLRALHHLSEEHAIVPEFLVYFLAPYNIEGDSDDQMIVNPHASSQLIQTRNLLTAEQIAVVRAFLEYVQRQSAEAESLGRFIEPALETMWKL